MTVLRVSLLPLLGIDETALVVDSAEAWAGLAGRGPEPREGDPAAPAADPGGSWPGAEGSPRRAGECVYHREEIRQLVSDGAPAARGAGEASGPGSLPPQGSAGGGSPAGGDGLRAWLGMLHAVKREFGGWIMPLALGEDGKPASEIDPPRRGGRPAWCAGISGLRPETREGGRGRARGRRRQ